MLNRTLMIAVLSVAVVGLWAPGFAAEPKEADVAKITAAAPEKAVAKPEAARKLLVFTRCGGFVHGSIATTAKAMEVLGKKTGAWETVISDDPAMLDADKLAGFDAVCLDNTTGKFAAKDKADDKAAERMAALKAFVEGGKGLVGIHAATDGEGGVLIGGTFAGHPWNGKVPVKLNDAAHPLCAAFGGQGFEISDEIYTFKAPYSREILHELASLDTDKMGDAAKKGNRPDSDYAVAWIRNLGKGRVFYCSLGHNNDIFSNAKVLKFYLDGTQYALGDLKIEAAATKAADGAEATTKPATSQPTTATKPVKTEKAPDGAEATTKPVTSQPTSTPATKNVK